MRRHLFRLSFMGLLLWGTIGMGQNINRPSEDLIRQAFLQSAAGKTLSTGDLSFELTDYYMTKKQGIQHIYLRQKWNGLEIIGTESSIHIAKSGKISSVKSKFVSSLEKRANQVAKTPQLSAIQATVAAANHLGYPVTNSFQIKSQSNSADQKTIISDGGISISDIPARLMYYLHEDGTMELVWDLSIESKLVNEWYNVRVNALNGKIVDKANWVNSCSFGHVNGEHEDQEGFHYHHSSSSLVHKTKRTELSYSPNALTAAYRVFAFPLESPYYGDRTLVNETDAVNLNASPFGWHDTNGVDGPEYTTTRGNNVNAYEDGNNPGFQPNPGNSMLFDYPFDQNYSNSNQYEPAAVTNLFYWNNIIHDIFYEYGFDEIGGNFQQNNYGKGGIGNDYVRAEAQDNSGTCNANFATPPDGQLPRMQMYICQNKDGDFDNLVITHEYGHGISNRLTGGPSNTNCLQNNEQMGEGWSDWFGLMLTMKPTDTATTPRAIGTYLFNQGINGAGIRTYRYSTDMTVNPHTYNSIKTEAIPHGVGSVWCAMLWDLTWALIDVHGYDPDIYHGNGGNNVALHLVLEALRLQPCSPGFVDGRNAILEADMLLYGGAHQCLIWDVFARRGLGVNASQGSSGSTQDGVESFETPSAQAAFIAPSDVCIATEPFIAGGGTPAGGVYSGPGVTDNGNGTFTFNPAAAGVGVHTITYSVPATACSEASSATDTIEVTPSVQIECLEDIIVNTNSESCSAIVTYTPPVGVSTCSANNVENFDNVSIPSLPSGWATSTQTGASNNWVTTSTQSSSAPNSAFAANLGSVSLSSLVSPEYQIGSSNAKLKFRLYYNTESGFDGVVLEYSTNNGSSWSDILNGGGTFVTGGYNGTLASGWSNPLPNRNAWTGNSNGFVSVEINLNSSFNGQNVKFRWRMGSDSLASSTGVWLDSVEIIGVYAPEPVTSQIAGLPSGSSFPVGITTNTFQVEDEYGNTATCSFNVIVNDGTPPVVNCPENQTVVVPAGGSYTLPDYWIEGSVTATDNCSAVTNTTQIPAPGTNLTIGTHTIQFTAEDASGNLGTCSFQLIVEEQLGVSDLEFADLISLYPNPTQDVVVIANQTKQAIQKVMVNDMSGKLIQVYLINNSNLENSISVKHLPTGTYILQIVGEKQSIHKKLIKK